MKHRAVLGFALTMSAACGEGGGTSGDNSGQGGGQPNPQGGNVSVAGSGGSTSGGVNSAGGATAGRESGGSAGAPASGGSAGMSDGGQSGAMTAGAAGQSGGGAGGSGPSAGSGGGSAGTSTSGAGGVGGAPPKSVCPAGPFPTPTVASTKSVCADFDFNHTYNEGPTWIASQGAFFFTNFVAGNANGGDIIKYTPGVGCELFITNVGCNGLAVSNDGNLLAACHQSRSVIRFDIKTKQPTTLASEYMGTLLDTPNDLVMHSNGGIYFSNPTFELQGRPAGVGVSVFRIDPAGALNLIARSSCNGIALSPDERKLYVLSAGMWDLDAAGVPSNRQDLFTSGDGMGVDCAGNVYASGTIFSAAGERIGQFASGTNLAFGGVDGKTLLVVGRSTQVRELQMNVPGLP